TVLYMLLQFTTCLFFPYTTLFRSNIEFKGQSAHASSHPNNGINALSAANLYFVATGLLRQHAKYDMRLSGIIENGGEATSLIPRSEEHTSELQSRFDIVCRLLLDK